MNLRLKYFGIFSDIMGRSEEIREFDDDITFDELANFFDKKYKFDDVPYKIAVNQSLTEDEVILRNNDEIAFLPPFAGG